MSTNLPHDYRRLLVPMLQRAGLTPTAVARLWGVEGADLRGAPYAHARAVVEGRGHANAEQIRALAGACSSDDGWPDLVLEYLAWANYRDLIALARWEASQDAEGVTRG